MGLDVAARPRSCVRLALLEVIDPKAVSDKAPAPGEEPDRARPTTKPAAKASAEGDKAASGG